MHLGGAAALVAPRRRPSHRTALVVEVLQPGRETLGVRNSGKLADVDGVQWVAGHGTSSGLTEQSATWWLLLLLGCWLRSPLPEQTDEVVTTAVAAAASGAFASGCNLH